MTDDIHPGRLREVQEIDLTSAWLEEQLAARVLEAIGAASTGTRTRIVAEGEPVAMITPCTRDSGPDLFRAMVYGDSYPALIEAAEAEARGFYGPDAPLAVEHAGTIHNTIGGQAAVTRGAYTTTVTIRCTQLPDGWDVP